MANRFWVGGTGTWDLSDTTHWSATSGGAAGASAPGSADTVTFDANSGGGTVTPNYGGTGAFTSITCGAFTGTIDWSVNNDSVTLSGVFSGSGSGTRTINLGSGTFTANGWQFATITNLTFNAGTSTVVITASSSGSHTTVACGALTYSTMQLSSQTNGGGFSITGVATFGTLTIAGKNNITFQSAVTITNLNLNGTSSGQIGIRGVTAGSRITHTITNMSASWVAFRDTGGTGTANDSFDLGNNSGITINAPDTSGGGGGGDVFIIEDEDSAMQVTGGSTDVTTYFKLRKTADGLEATGLTITDLDLQYTRSGAAPAAKVDATALASAGAAHGDNQAFEIDGTDQPGVYRVDWPDAAFAAGVKEVILTVKHSTCFTKEVRVTIDAPVNLTSISADQQSATDLKDFADAGYDPATNKVEGVKLVDTLTTYTGNTVQTGDSFARIGATGSGLTSLASQASVDTIDNLVDDLESRIGTPSDLGGGATVAANLVVIEGQTDDIGVAGAGLTEAGGDGDHLTAINLPNQTMDITGNITGNLSGSVGSVTGAVGSVTAGVTLAASAVQAIWDALTAALTTANSIGKLLVDNINATISSRSSHTAANVRTEMDSNSTQLAAIVADTNELQTDWVDGGRLDLILDARASQSSLSSLITTVGVAGAGLTAADDATLAAIAALNNLSSAQAQSAAEAALVTHRLDELLNADSDIDGAAPPTVGSVFHELMSKTAGSFTFDQTTDSNEAIRDRGDAAWVTATGFSTHSASDVWAVGTRVLTAGTNIVLAKGTGVTGFNDLSAAQVNAEVDTALSDVGLTTTVTGRIDEAVSTRATPANILTTALTESYAADGAAPTLAQFMFMFWADLHEFSISGTTITAKKLDKSTTAMTHTLDSATTPTSKTRAT